MSDSPPTPRTHDAKTPPTQSAKESFAEAPNVTNEALTTFTEVTECIYRGRHLGRAGQKEIMTCDCTEQWDEDLALNLACGDDSNCINRLTSVECVNGTCICGTDCRNQRFQKKQYARVKVVHTEKKGYGLVAQEALAPHQFIYEYLGEVIDEGEFRERMAAYDARNLRHFYFMMLAKDAFIDATERGCLARFCNHSCSPNAYADKWVVGDRLRMGIFAKTAIRAGEEITFDYNVDRYGAQLQPCYCGLSNCLGSMRGKTQTDAALLLPDGLAEALGVTQQQERAWLKQNKQSRLSKQVHGAAPTDDSAINEMFVRSLTVTPLTKHDVTRAMSALMKAEEPAIVDQLVQRVYLTEAPEVNALIVRLHGYKTLLRVLRENSGEEALMLKVLLTLKRWPQMTKNKIELSQIEQIVREIEAALHDDEVRELAQSLLSEWSKLEMAYRIPKNTEPGSEDAAARSASPIYARNARSQLPQRSALVDDDDDLLEGWLRALDAATNTYYYYHVGLGISRWERPTGAVPTGPKKLKDKKDKKYKKEKRDKKLKDKIDPMQLHEEMLRRQKEEQFTEIQNKERLLQELIVQSQQEASERKRQEEEARVQKLNKIKELRRRPKEAAALARERDKKTPLELWTATLARYVPNLVKKHEPEIGHHNVKGCARELVKVLAAKELKRDAASKPPTSLDLAKIKKLRKFCDVWMDKFLVKYKSKRARKEQTEGQRKESKTEG